MSTSGGKREFVKSVSLLTGRDQSKTERKSKSIEDFALADRLLSEVKLLALRQKNGFSTKSHAMSKYTEDNIPFYLLSHENTIIRRLTSVLIALIFEEKSDLFRYKLHKNLKNACIENNRLFLSVKTPAIRNFRPEPLYHVSNPFMYYVSKSSFPRGLTCYLDTDKLYATLLLKEWMRLPDPMEHLIWMNFGESSVLLNLNEEESHDEVEESAADANSPEQLKQNFKIEVLRKPLDVPLDSSPKNRIDARSSICQELDAESPRRSPQNPMASMESLDGDASGVHRIKCFQFFRKQKTVDNTDDLQPFKELLGLHSQPLDEDSPNRGNYFQKIEAFLAKQQQIGDRSRQSSNRRIAQTKSEKEDDLVNAPAPRKLATPPPPQFESVNDWATDKDYTFYSTQMKFLPVNNVIEKKSKLKELVQKATEVEKTPKNKHQKMMHDLVSTLAMKQLVSKGSKEPQTNLTQLSQSKPKLSSIVKNQVIRSEKSPKMVLLVPELL